MMVVVVRPVGEHVTDDVGFFGGLAMQERLFTAYQVADLLGATPGVVAGWIQDGRLISQRLPGGSRRISERQLVQFLRHEGIDFEQILADVATEEESNTGQSSSCESQAVAVVARPDAPPEVVSPAERAALQLPRSDPSVFTSASESAPAEPTISQGPAESVDVELPEAFLTPEPVETDPPEAAIAPDPAPAPVEAEAEPQPAALAPDAPEMAPPHEDEPVAPPTKRKPARRKAKSRQRSGHKKAQSPAQMARAIVDDALGRGATAIHIEADDDDAFLRLRLHLRLGGRLQQAAGPAKKAGAGLIDHFMSLASLDGPARTPQSGEFDMGSANKATHVRMSAVRTPRGCKLVLRVTAARAGRGGLSQLNLSRDDTKAMVDLLARPFGLMILSAPPRSSSELTLGAVAGHLAASGRSVFYLARGEREPIDGVTYCTCSSATGTSWSAGLTAGIAQDADVVAIEDITDPATARAAVEAASAGAMVIGVVRSSSPAQALTMLAKMGVEPWALTSVLTAVLEQRSVRTLCEDCRKRSRPQAGALSKLGLDRKQVDKSLYAAGGCDKCNSSGYLGQTVLLTVTPVDESLGDVIRDAPGEQALHDAIRSHTPGLLARGLELLNDGATTLDELIRAQLN